MALNATTKNQSFELLKISNAEDAVIHNGFGVALELSRLDELRDATLEHLENVSADVEVEIESIIAAYQPYRFSVMKLSGAAAGGTSGFEEDPEAMRTHLRGLLQTYIPIYTIAASLAKREDRGTSNAMSYPIIGRW